MRIVLPSTIVRVSAVALVLASVLLATWAPMAAQGRATTPSGGNGTFYIRHVHRPDPGHRRAHLDGRRPDPDAEWNPG